MSNERLQILNMVRDRKITVEEASKLLDALYTKNTASPSKWIRIKVSEPRDSNKINLSLPASLFSVGVKLAEKFSPEFKDSGLTQRDLDEISKVIDSGVTGRVVHIETSKGEKVEVIIE